MIYCPLAVGVAWARVYQPRHTPVQVIVGAMTAAAIVLPTTSETLFVIVRV